MLKNVGCLDRCSAFPFEKYMHKLKKMVRSRKNPIVQLVKRLDEIENVDTIQSITIMNLKFQSTGQTMHTYWRTPKC